jgi:tetratricopeptide (TPR) repeat protein
VHWLVGIALLGAAAFAFQARLALPQKVAAVQSLTTRDSLVTTQKKHAARTHVSGRVLNDAGFALLRAGDYRAAAPLLELAVQRLRGSGSIIDAYALYNLAYARFALGRCDGVLAMLERSQKRQGHRNEIDHLRSRALERCGGR